MAYGTLSMCENGAKSLITVYFVSRDSRKTKKWVDMTILEI